MDTNASLNWYLRRNLHLKLVVQYDELRGNHGLYVASLAGQDAPKMVGIGPDIAAAVCNLNVFIAALRVEAERTA